MKDGFNLKTLFPSYNETYLQRYNFIGDTIILSVFTVFFCIIGLLGNGFTVWLLGFRIKRNSLAIYILNLAVADFGTLVLLPPFGICLLPVFLEDYLVYDADLAKLLISLFVSMYSSSQLLLTAISTDRWVSVLFRNWYQSHQSPELSTTVCVFLWGVSFALIGTPIFLLLMDFISEVYRSVLFVGYTITGLSSLLLVFISTLTLFIKNCLKSQPCHCGNLSKVIFITLLSFLLFTVLTDACGVMMPVLLPAYLVFWISVQRSISPLIYFLAGRKKVGKFQERMKVILQTVFREERDTRIELQPHNQTVL